MLRARIPAWEDPEKSIGRRSAVIKGKTVWEATGPAADVFENKLFGIIDQLLQAHKEDLQSGEKISRAVSFHLWMVGREPQTARPTIIFTCKSSAYRTKVIRLLEKHNVLADFPGMALKSMDRMPAQPMGGGCNQGRQQLHGDIHDLEEKIIYLRAGFTHTCGSSIFVGNNHEATLGGVLLINGTYYGLTSLHPRQDRNSSLESLVGDDGKLAFDDDSDTTSTRTKSLHSIYPSSVNLSFHRSSIDLSPTSSRSGDKRNNARSSTDTTTNVENFHRIGAVIEGNSRRDLDYDIFPIEDPSLHVANRIVLPRVQGKLQEFLNTEKIASKVMESKVWVATGKSGTIKGTLVNNPYFIKMAGSESYQKMWPVQLETNIVPGDCGSWVVDAQSGDLYGHIVAGDASLRRAYIIPASDVMRDIRNRFQHNATLPNDSNTMPNCKSFFPRVDLGSTTFVGRQTASGYHGKEWAPIFSQDQNFKEDGSWKKSLSGTKGEANDFDVSQEGEGSVTCFKVDEIEEFCQGASLETLKLGAGPAGVRRAAWLDDWSFDCESRIQTRRRWGGHENPLTATGLYRSLKAPRFDNIDKPDADRRLIYIENLDPYYIIALGETASLHQVTALRDAIWSHLFLQPLITVRVSPRGYPIFQMALQIPFFALRSSPPPATPRSVVHTSPPRQQTDLSFLELERPELQNQRKYIMHEAQISFLICGSDEFRWAAYCFVDAHFDDSEFGDETSSYEGIQDDPIARGKIEGNSPIDNPREYFLAIFEIRTAQVSEEWQYLVRMVERAIKRSRNQSLPSLSPHPRTQYSRNSEDRVEDAQKNLEWTRRTIDLLSQLQERLSETIEAWECFSSSDGDIGYFSNLTSSSDGPQRRNVCSSLSSITRRFEILKALQRKLVLLDQICQNRARALQLLFIQESSEAVWDNRGSIKLLILILSPFALAMAYFSIPQTAIPFQLTFKSFVITILVSMAAIWVLVFMQGVLLRRPLKKNITWVNTHHLTRGAWASWDKLGLRRRIMHGRTPNAVEAALEEEMESWFAELRTGLEEKFSEKLRIGWKAAGAGAFGGTLVNFADVDKRWMGLYRVKGIDYAPLCSLFAIL